MPIDLIWPWITIALSLVVAAGYCAIAINWYFQQKVSRPAESRAALVRLRSLCLCSIVCGFIFFMADMPWTIWRLYDLMLLILAVRTWSFVFHMRGLSLVDQRLAELDVLERSVASASADVEYQKRVAAEHERQARQKSFFFNALSHDLRAPLHNVVLNAHVLKLSACDEGEAQSLNMIVENAVAAGDLVAKLLDFAKIGAHEQNTLENISMADILHPLQRRFLPIAQEKGLCLRIEGDDHETRAVTDRQKLQRIIANLLDNAIKYTKRGGVSVEVGAQNDGGEICIRIIDTGNGIGEAEIPHLFDEFYQVNNRERDHGKGFGMGLAICKCLARQIGADVRLAATGPAGSCFEVIAPSAPADRPQQQASAHAEHVNAQSPPLCSA